MIVVMVPGWQAGPRQAMHGLQVDMAEETANDARQNIISAGLVRSGDLLGSVRQSGTRVYIGTDHWAPIEHGAHRHTIRPRFKKALWWPGLEHPVGSVNHPGNRTYAPMQRALYTKRG